MELLKAENDRNFIIFIRGESTIFRVKALTALKKLFLKSTCNHKIALIKEEQGCDEVGRQIYYNLIGSLNLVYLFTHDGYLNTHGIRIIENSPITSTLISTNIEPIPIEIANIKPIILDLSRCGVLEPILYFVARDFGTCIGQILLPGASTWSLVYFVQCDDSGKMDSDMVKVCLVNEDREGSQPSETLSNQKVDPFNDLKDRSVLNDREYPFCRELASLLYDLVNLSPDLTVVDRLKQVNSYKFIYFFIYNLENQCTNESMRCK